MICWYRLLSSQCLARAQDTLLSLPTWYFLVRLSTACPVTHRRIDHESSLLACFVIVNCPLYLSSMNIIRQQ
ncbi:hypothetical protein HD554DRAFT_2118304 [Boletus coccyginus]|nr:hypothetical protein HD554DRAFT_2118304 [Boletus coccyginus]